MKTITVTLECASGCFKVDREFDTNEHGYFELGQPTCPVCLCPLGVGMNKEQEALAREIG